MNFDISNSKILNFTIQKSNHKIQNSSKASVQTKNSCHPPIPAIRNFKQQQFLEEIMPNKQARGASKGLSPV